MEMRPPCLKTSDLVLHSFSMRRCILLAAAAAFAGAFAPGSSTLPSIRRAKAQCSLVMKSEADVAAENLSKRRLVVGGLFAMLAPIAGLPEGADAAKSGGRMGGGSFRPKAAPGGGARGRAAPATAPTVINRPSVTVIQSAPSMPFGGYGGYGGGMFGRSRTCSIKCVPSVEGALCRQ